MISLLILPNILAIDLSIAKQSENEVMISDLNEPVTFDLKVTNNGASGKFDFYNLLGFMIESPTEPVQINAGETKDVQLKISPIGEFKNTGTYNFKYYIQASDKSEQIEELTFRIVKLGDAFEIGSDEINSESNSLQIYIHNKENFNFENLNVKFSSPFFEFEKIFSLEPNKRENFDIKLDKEDFKKLMAGFYTLKAEINFQEKQANTEGIIRFTEKDLLTTKSEDYGIIIHTNIISKTNEGNVLTSSETIIKKNIISRIFTSFSPQPDSVERDGMAVYYTWAKEIKPGETLEIVVKTNWLYPLLIIFFIVAIVVLVKQNSKTDLILKKRVSFVKAKGGEFALKVSVFVHAKNYVERVNLIDRLPALTRIYERFGGEQPTRVDEKGKKIEWNFEKLEAGEIRTISYIIYSKLGVVGKFALPSATAIYDKNGEIKESQSNRAFFVAEQRGESDE